MESQRPCVALLGASNLALGLELAVGVARARLARPLEVHAACGLGRSYGLETRVLGRTLPGIDRCGLWAGLAARRPRFALVTDLGNDLAFGARAGLLASWLEETLLRLSGPDTRGVISGMPLAKLEATSELEFRLWKAILFPFRRLERSALLGEAREFEERATELARRFGWTFVQPSAQWYGHDPIHYARERRELAWRTLLAPWGGEFAAPVASAPRRGRLEYAEVRRLGLRMGCPQPCAGLGDGTTFSLY